MGYPITKNRMEEGGDAWTVEGDLTVKAGATLTVESGASVEGIVAASQATTSTAGKVELATDAEAVAGSDTARAVTPHALAAAIAKMFPLSWNGRDGAGACSAPGAAVGDKVLGVTQTGAGGTSDAFEATVSVVDQVQQTSGSDLSSGSYLGLLVRLS